MKGDEAMADKKDNKPAEDDSPFNSSGELFETNNWTDGCGDQ